VPGSPIPLVCVTHQGGESVLARVEWIAQVSDWNAVTCIAEAFEPAMIETLASGIGAGQPLLVVHVAELGDMAPGAEAREVSTIGEARRRLDAEISAAFPAVDVRSWAIVMTGHRIEEELGLAALLSTIGRGVLVTAAATADSVRHEAPDEAAFAANLVTVLASSELEGELAGRESVWFATASSVVFSLLDLKRAVAARWLRDRLDELCSEVGVDEAFEIGESYTIEFGLEKDAAVERLLDSGAGGSLQDRVRFRTIDLDEVPIEGWSDVILGQFDLITVNALPIVREQIQMNAEERLEDLKDTIRRRLLQELQETGKVASPVAMCRGIYAALDRALLQLADRTPSSDELDVAEDRRKLRDFARWMPFGPAVGLRLLAASLLGFVLTAFLEQGFHAPIDPLASWHPAG